MGHTVEHCATTDALAEAAASYVYRQYEEAVSRKGIFTLVLSGGKTPEALHRKLASEDFRSRFNWGQVHVFMGDERYVPHDHEQSNFGMARRTLLSHVPIPDENLFPIPTEAATVAEAAKLYEENLKKYFHGSNAAQGTPPMPVFDLILLGLGKDGHAASLFLDRFIDPNGESWVESVTIPASYPTRERITLTLPVLNAAAQVAFLVSGENKKKTLVDVLNGADPGKEIYAAQLIHTQSDIMWFTDIKLS
jgi:6-phosphogluconolactonase